MRPYSGLYEHMPISYRSGRWRSEYIVDLAANSVTGLILVNVHYYENGNVQLETKHDGSLTLPPAINASSPTPSATKILALIQEFEGLYQTSLADTYHDMSEKSFKSLRRALPLTRQKLDWDRVRRAVSSYLSIELSTFAGIGIQTWAGAFGREGRLIITIARNCTIHGHNTHACMRYCIHFCELASAASVIRSPPLTDLPCASQPSILRHISTTPSSSHPTCIPLSRKMKYSRAGVCMIARAGWRGWPPVAVKCTLSTWWWLWHSAYVHPG